MGLNLKRYTITGVAGAEYNFILNNKGTHPENVAEGVQYDAFKVTLSADVTSVFYKLTDTGATELQVAALAPKRKH